MPCPTNAAITQSVSGLVLLLSDRRHFWQRPLLALSSLTLAWLSQFVTIPSLFPIPGHIFVNLTPVVKFCGRFFCWHYFISIPPSPFPPHCFFVAVYLLPLLRSLFLLPFVRHHFIVAIASSSFNDTFSPSPFVVAIYSSPFSSLFFVVNFLSGFRHHQVLFDIFSWLFLCHQFLAPW